MKKSITYDNIENVKYEFTEQEVLKAICKAYDIVTSGKEYEFTKQEVLKSICKAYDIVISGKEYEFNIYQEDFEDNIDPHADLIIYYKTRVEK